VHVMAFEIHVLAIVNELYFRRFDQAPALAEGRRRLAEKVQMLRDFGTEPPRRHPFEFFDFGVRRRFSGAWHREVVATLAREVPEYFKGTSCVLLARDAKTGLDIEMGPRDLSFSMCPIVPRKVFEALGVGGSFVATLQHEFPKNAEGVMKKPHVENYLAYDLYLAPSSIERPEAADGGGKPLGVFRGTADATAAVGTQQFETPHLRAEGTGDVVVLAMHVVRQRAAQGDKARARRDRQADVVVGSLQIFAYEAGIRLDSLLGPVGSGAGLVASQPGAVQVPGCVPQAGGSAVHHQALAKVMNAL